MSCCILPQFWFLSSLQGQSHMETIDLVSRTQQRFKMMFNRKQKYEPASSSSLSSLIVPFHAGAPLGICVQSINVDGTSSKWSHSIPLSMNSNTCTWTAIIFLCLVRGCYNEDILYIIMCAEIYMALQIRTGLSLASIGPWHTVNGWHQPSSKTWATTSCGLLGCPYHLLT